MLPALVSCAGTGTRPDPITRLVAKAAVPMAGSTLVERILSWLATRGVRDIVINLHHAYRRPEFRDRHYASFHTGPSATADIEGVLIHGAQGVRSLSVLPLPRTAPDKPIH